jgi:V/A-type H+-transporting ATPase subunit F
MYNIGVIGDYDSIYGFQALGLSVFPVKSASEGEQVLKHLAESNYAVVYITEKFAVQMTKVIDKYREALTPAIILIPGVSGNTGEGVLGVKKSVEQAVGSDILFSNN